MKASFVDLRKKSGEILKALNRNETITIFYRGRPKAVMKPISQQGDLSNRVQDHPAFGMWSDREDMKDVAAYVRSLRKGRFDDR